MKKMNKMTIGSLLSATALATTGVVCAVVVNNNTKKPSETITEKVGKTPSVIGVSTDLSVFDNVLHSQTMIDGQIPYMDDSSVNLKINAKDVSFNIPIIDQQLWVDYFDDDYVSLAELFKNGCIDPLSLTFLNTFKDSETCYSATSSISNGKYSASPDFHKPFSQENTNNQLDKTIDTSMLIGTYYITFRNGYYNPIKYKYVDSVVQSNPSRWTIEEIQPGENGTVAYRWDWNVPSSDYQTPGAQVYALKIYVSFDTNINYSLEASISSDKSRSVSLRLKDGVDSLNLSVSTISSLYYNGGPERNFVCNGNFKSNNNDLKVTISSFKHNPVLIPDEVLNNFNLDYPITIKPYLFYHWDDVVNTCYLTNSSKSSIPYSVPDNVKDEEWTCFDMKTMAKSTSSEPSYNIFVLSGTDSNGKPKNITVNNVHSLADYDTLISPSQYVYDLYNYQFNTDKSSVDITYQNTNDGYKCIQPTNPPMHNTEHYYDKQYGRVFLGKLTSDNFQYYLSAPDPNNVGIGGYQTWYTSSCIKLNLLDNVTIAIDTNNGAFGHYE